MNKQLFHELNVEKINIFDRKKAINEIDRQLETRIRLFSKEIRRDSKKSAGSSIKSSEKIKSINLEKNDLMVINGNTSSLIVKKNTPNLAKMVKSLKKYNPSKIKKQLSETTDLIDKSLKDSNSPIKQDTSSNDFTKSKEFADIIVPISVMNQNTDEPESFIERFEEV